MTISIDEFFSLRKQLPVIDVRSEGEFADGHMRNAINIPILNNEDRVLVGTDYKKLGQKEAIKTGFRLVGPRLHDIVSEAERIANGKELLVHCWRGGMRSSNFSLFAGMAGIKSYVLKGGYKGYRNLALESFKSPFKFVLITGCTGSGKSEVLRCLKNQGEQVLDLESMANHKGSVFGGLLMPPQPTTEQFQNELFEEILSFDLNRRIWVEDESIAIGKIFLPPDFWKAMHQGSLIQMIVPKEVRVQRLVEEYGAADREEFLDIMGKITKRLGGQHYLAAKEKLLSGNMAGTIEILLNYYDKAYNQSIDRRNKNVVLKAEWNGEDISGFSKYILEQTKGAD